MPSVTVAARTLKTPSARASLAAAGLVGANLIAGSAASGYRIDGERDQAKAGAARRGGTLPKALQATAYSGHIALVGGLSGFTSDIPLGAINPVVDRISAFEEAPAAFDFMENGSFFGKIVIRS